METSRFCSATDASVPEVVEQTPASDDEEQSAPTPNGRLLSRKSERVRHARYVRELASQTTKAEGHPLPGRC
jgi:hypothetical protein